MSEFRLYTVKEAAAELGIDPSTLRRTVERLGLQLPKLGRGWRLTRADIAAVIDGLRCSSSSPPAPAKVIATGSRAGASVDGSSRSARARSTKRLLNALLSASPPPSSTSRVISLDAARSEKRQTHGSRSVARR